MGKHLEFEEFEKVTSGITLEEFYEEVKKLPGITIYQRAVREKSESTAKTLTALILMHALTDPVLRAKFDTLAFEFLGSLLDTKFRAEMGVGKE